MSRQVLIEMQHLSRFSRTGQAEVIAVGEARTQVDPEEEERCPELQLEENVNERWEENIFPVLLPAELVDAKEMAAADNTNALLREAEYAGFHKLVAEKYQPFKKGVTLDNF